MAALPTADIDELSAQLQREFSGTRTGIPVNKNQFRAGLVNIDSELNTAETAIFQGISDATVKAWLLANQPIGRLLIERVERKRKEVL